MPMRWKIWGIILFVVSQTSRLQQYLLWQDLSVDIKNFGFVTMTLVFDLFFENFNLGHIFSMVCIRPVMSIPCDKTFPRVPTILTL
jgi:hypothetical protein